MNQVLVLTIFYLPESNNYVSFEKHFKNFGIVIFQTIHILKM